LIMVMIFLSSLWLNHSVVTPLHLLMNRFSLGASGDFTVRMPVRSKDEIGQLATFFNSFMETLEIYQADLTSEIKKHKKSLEALRLSEEMFSKVFRCSPSGLFIASLEDGRVFNVNESFLAYTGYTHESVLGKDLVALNFFRKKTDGPKLMERLVKERRLDNIEIRFQTYTGKKRTGFLSAEIVELLGEPCILAAMEDLTESRRLEREVLDISERERQKIAMELHDDLCPQLIGIEVMTKVLTKNLDEKSLEEASSAHKIRTHILDTIDKARMLSQGLSPVNLCNLGFDTSLEELAQYVQDVFHISCILEYNAMVPFQDNQATAHIYYIVHEAVHNAVKHAVADKISIELTATAKNTIVKVKDNGKGFNSHEISQGMGMRIMEYRAARIGGMLTIKENLQGGILVALEVKH
ncbi:MAG: PAS domain S-box protein, partial [Desulfobacteraceae bacterium]|nr:PAS domain S-box protein [Desulfobacteraceae bacterium]